MVLRYLGTDGRMGVRWQGMVVQRMFLPAVTAALCHPPAATDLTPCDRKFGKVCKCQCVCSSVRLLVSAIARTEIKDKETYRA